MQPQNTPARLMWRLWIGLALATLLWDATPLDRIAMDAIGSPGGFPLQHHPVLEVWLHDRFRAAAWLVFLAGWAWALPPADTAYTTRSDRVFLMAMVVFNLLLVSVLKHFSLTSCPWAIADWGGVGRYVSHWQWGAADGGGGRCFPGGHASAAWGFFPLVVAAWWPATERSAHPRARLVTVVFVLAALTTAATQTLRGAHYPSHTLWTAILCAGSTLLAWTIWLRRRNQSFA